MPEEKNTMVEMIQASGIAPNKVNEALASFEIAIAKEAVHSDRSTIILEEGYDLPVIADSLQVGPVMSGEQLQNLLNKMKNRIVAENGHPLTGDLGLYELDSDQKLTFRIGSLEV